MDGGSLNFGPVADNALAVLELGGRVVISGGPRVGKTSLARFLFDEAEARYPRGIMLRHTDSLIETHDWSGASDEVVRWLDAPGPWVIEGVAAVRALRKWLEAHATGAPAELVLWSDVPRVARTKGQQAMARGSSTIWRSVSEELDRREGVRVRRF